MNNQTQAGQKPTNTIQKVYAIGGTRIKLELYSGVADRFILNWEMIFDLTLDSSADCDITINFKQQSFPMPLGFKQEQAFENHVIEVWRNGNNVYATLYDSVALVDAENGHAEVFIDDRFLDLGLALQRDFLTVILLCLLRRHGLFGVHANALVSPEDETNSTALGILILGASGAGKTSLTLSLILQGWQFLPDDILFMQVRQKVATDVSFWGLRRGYGCMTNTMQKLPKLKDADVLFEIPSRDKHVLDMKSYLPHQAKMLFSPSVLLYPKLSYQADSQLRRLTKRESALRFFEQSPGIVQKDDFAQLHADSLAKLVKEIPAYELQAGTDVLDNPAEVSELIQSIRL